MSPKRFQHDTRIWVYRYLVLRDGEQCARCFEIPTAHYSLDIDHIDGDPQNNDPANLRLLCRKCNVTLSNQARSPCAKSVWGGYQIQSEQSKTTRVIKEAANYPAGSPEMHANFLFEVDFREWLLGIIQERGFIPKEDAITAGAEVVGCSPNTTIKYLSKLTSSAGPLKEVRDMLGMPTITWKEEFKPEPTIKIDLEKKES